jgi:antitoxin (DNA-binding transcriptional repressor) of toxin-antitoxin stability system
MKTLTITDAKKNLGHWLAEAAKGNDVGIISGADIIALRKVDVESTDYPFREYGLTKEELSDLDERVEKDYQKQKKAGKLQTFTAEQLKKMLEKARHHKS